LTFRKTLFRSGIYLPLLASALPSPPGVMLVATHIFGIPKIQILKNPRTRQEPKLPPIVLSDDQIIAQLEKYIKSFEDLKVILTDETFHPKEFEYEGSG